MKHNQVAEPGFYWLKQPKHDPLVPNPCVVHVEEWDNFEQNGKSSFVYAPYLSNDYVLLKHAGPDAEWIGPIVPPASAR